METENLVVIGKITKPQGIRGEVRFQLSSISFEILETLKEVNLEYPTGKLEVLSIEKVRPHKNFVVIKLGGVDDRNQAELLRDCWVKIPAENLPSLPEGEFYEDELIGVSVFTDKEELVGELKEVWHLPANDVFVVLGNGKEILIPAIEDVILEIDLDEEKIVISPIEGLLD